MEKVVRTVKQRIEVRMSVKQYAQHKNVSERTVQRWIAEEKIKTDQPAPHCKHQVIVFF